MIKIKEIFFPGSYKADTSDLIALVVIFFAFAFQIFFFSFTQDFVIPLLFNAMLFSFIVYILFFKDLPTFLLFLSIIPLAYIDRVFSRYFNYIIIQNIPLYLLAILSVFLYLQTTKRIQIGFTSVTYPVALYAFASIALLALGIMNKADSMTLAEEFYQNFYFVLVFPISYLLAKRKNYKFLFNVILVVFILIAIEYIIFNLVVPYRFTTYHNHYFPFVLAILLSKFLYEKNTLFKIIYVLLIFIVWWGSYATQTRILLVANFLATIIVLFLYLNNRKTRIKWVKIITVIILFLLPFMFLSDTKKATTSESNAHERVQSIANPLGELSFLMRIEALIVGMNEILKDPIIGKGFGFQLDLKYLLQEQVTYPDNNYIYYWLKGGIFFLIISLLMFYVFLKKSFQLFKATENQYVKVMMLANIGGMIALLFFGLFNANLVKLKLNLLYVISFAYLDFEIKRETEYNNVNESYVDG